MDSSLVTWVSWGGLLLTLLGVPAWLIGQVQDSHTRRISLQRSVTRPKRPLSCLDCSW